MSMKSTMTDAAQIAQSQLPGDRLRGLQVGFEDGVVEIARANIAACVHIDGGQRFGLIDDQVAARYSTPPDGLGPSGFPRPRRTGQRWVFLLGNAAAWQPLLA